MQSTALISPFMKMELDNNDKRPKTLEELEAEEMEEKAKAKIKEQMEDMEEVKLTEEEVQLMSDMQNAAEAAANRQVYSTLIYLDSWAYIVKAEAKLTPC